MSICVRRSAEVAPEVISSLRDHLQAYYNNPPEEYYRISDQAASQYLPAIQPFHCDLVRRVKPGMKVLELGCGSAHLCPFVEASGGRYTGMDYSAELLKNTRQNFRAQSSYRSRRS